jgi:hypothetical protein
MVLTKMRHQIISGIFARLSQSIHYFGGHSGVVPQYPWNLLHSFRELAD